MPADDLDPLVLVPLLLLAVGLLLAFLGVRTVTKAPGRRPGDAVAVAHDPTDQTRAEHDGRLAGGCVGLVLVLVGVCVALLGLGMLALRSVFP